MYCALRRQKRRTLAGGQPADFYADGDSGRLNHQQAGYLLIKPSARAWFEQRKRCR